MRTTLALSAAALVAGAAASGACSKKSGGQNGGEVAATQAGGEESMERPAGGTARSGAPVETRPPNVPSQKPAFAGQTRAPHRPSGVELDVQTIAGGLEHPWGLAFLPGGELLVTERAGRMRIVREDGSLSQPVAGIPEVDARDQGGLLDVVLDPAYGDNQRIYWSYSEPREGGYGTAVARARLVTGERPRVEGVQVIWRMTPTLDSTKHFGGRLVFARGGDTLFITTGERSILAGRRQAQELDSALGKVIRVRPDGSIPPDNPLVGRDDALPAIWSWGHRNVQAAALHPETGELWIVDHGPQGGDEVNVVRKGKNYGWPVITYGEEYGGGPIGEGITAKEGMEQPLYYWDPVSAPSGMAFYDGDLFEAWKGSLLVGGLAGEHVARLELEGERVVGEERLLEGKARFRDVRVGPDGAVYLLTDEDDGEILRLVPRGG